MQNDKAGIYAAAGSFAGRNAGSRTPGCPGYYEEYFDAAGPEKETLTLGEKADGYSVQAACGLGSITVSGAKQASPYSANSKAANAVILDAALGDITLNFEE